ncbi:hypothetical protein SC1_02512 [Sphingopyxis sp. C-1]|nr:hypothetical protein SC1_02512 [Sphingopyxis sp. C-1]
MPQPAFPHCWTQVHAAIGQAESRGRYRPACRLPQASLTLFCGWIIFAAQTRSPIMGEAQDKRINLP